MAIVCVGVDLAKNVFAIHGIDEVGKAVWVQPRVPRAQLLAAFSNLPPCLIGMEACLGPIIGRVNCWPWATTCV